MSEHGLEFLSRLGVSIAVLGSALVLASVSVTSVVEVMNRQEVVADDLTIRQQLANGNDIFTPVETRIQEREQLIGKLRDPIAAASERKRLAPLYNELGRKSFDLGQFARAEESFQRSLAVDPDNTVTLGNLAGLYASAAVRQSERRQRLTLFRNASNYFETARTREINPNRKREFEVNAASSRFSVATELQRSGLNNEAIRELQRARALVPNDSPLAAQINRMLSSIGDR
ncbi:MAG: tetratricopeptide repeat protein [Methanoregulaceae archaeon]|nr:tetratricopeptide repeat protein [Methanoregulaceae archaeon]